MNWVAQIIGVGALITWVLSIQTNQRQKVLRIQVVANVLYGIQYCLLHIFTAGCLNFLSAIRCLLYEKKQKAVTSIGYLLLFVLIVLLIGWWTYDGILSIIPIIITLIYTYASWQKNLTVFRVLFLLCAGAWTTYNLSVGAYAAFLGNIFEIISGVTSLLRFDLLKKRNISR